MRNKTLNQLLTAAFLLSIIVSTFLLFLPLTNIGNEIPWIQQLKANSDNISNWIITVLFGVISNKLKKPVLKCEQYCFDRYFIDRIDERNMLFTFLELENHEDRGLFIVKGGMCRGKTALLQRFADDVNGFGDVELSGIKRKCYKKYSAYYIEIDPSAEDILSEIGKSLYKYEDLNTIEKVMSFLKKASYKKKTVLLIDNISRMQSYRATEAAHQLLYRNPFLKIILSITEESLTTPSLQVRHTLTPSLFGEMHINELAKVFHKGISAETNKEIVRISNGIPSYIIMIFKAGILDNKPITLSNFEHMQNVVQMQLSRLGEDCHIVGYLVCLKLCYDGLISKSELLSLASISEQQLAKVFDVALAEERIVNQQPYVFMNDLVAKCCLKTISQTYYLPMIHSFYQGHNTDISLVATIMLGKNVNTNEIMTALKEKYDRGKFLIFTKLGNLDEEGMLLTFRNNPDLYNFFRFYHLNSLLQLGEYSLAISTLRLYENSNVLLPSLHQAYSESGFDFQYLIIDLHHLSNQFQLALGEIDSILLAEEKLAEEKAHKLLYLKAHCLKHLGNQLEEADYILSQMQLKKLSNSLSIKVLYSRLAIHMFWGDTKFNYASILQELENIIQNETPEWAHTLRHKAYFEWLQTRTAESALRIIDTGLEVLEKTRWRIIYDFYFEKAEWMRIQNKEQKEIIHKIEDILNYYNKAIDFATENGDINLSCCARLGKILACFPYKGESLSWRENQLQIVNDEIIKVGKTGLEINKAYVQRIKFLLMKEKPSEEFKYYCEKMRFSNLSLSMSHQQELKLTVM